MKNSTQMMSKEHHQKSTQLATKESPPQAPQSAGKGVGFLTYKAKSSTIRQS